MQEFDLSLFIFHRDLRLADNKGLLKALEKSNQVIPIFIFDTRQLEKNDYRSDTCLQFMLDSLIDLDAQLESKGSRLYCLQGITHDVVKTLIKQLKVNAVFSNCDYTPFSIQRDLNIKHVCDEHTVAFDQTHDALLNEPDSIQKNDGGVYTVYTPYMKKSSQIKVPVPVKNKHTGYYSKTIKGVLNLKTIAKDLIAKRNDYVKGGRAEGVKILKTMARFENYDKVRDLPALNQTTHLSAHNKFGTVSIREVYHCVLKAFNKEHTLIRELYWRDFFTSVGFHHPHVLGGSFYEKYDRLKWNNRKSDFKAWCEGKTGFPIVDAGMRELNTTGFMHNRVRMITASFLVKDLLIDWRWGEKYFAQKLVDYDPLVNNGNWQWAASTGCDAQPYFRIFNPWRQQKRFDPECEYIKKWVPELRALSVKDIHGLETGTDLFTSAYVSAIVDHKQSAAKAKKLFQSV